MISLFVLRFVLRFKYVQTMISTSNVELRLLSDNTGISSQEAPVLVKNDGGDLYLS